MGFSIVLSCKASVSNCWVVDVLGYAAIPAVHTPEEFLGAGSEECLPGVRSKEDPLGVRRKRSSGCSPHKIFSAFAAKDLLGVRTKT